MMIERMIKSFSRKRALPVLVGNNKLHPTPPILFYYYLTKLEMVKEYLKGLYYLTLMMVMVNLTGRIIVTAMKIILILSIKTSRSRTE